MLDTDDLAQIRAIVRDELAALRRRPRRRPCPEIPAAIAAATAPLGAALDAWLARHPADACTLAEAAEGIDVAPTQWVLTWLGRLLHARGWTHERRKIGGFRQWRYHRPAARR